MGFLQPRGKCILLYQETQQSLFQVCTSKLIYVELGCQFKARKALLINTLWLLLFHSKQGIRQRGMKWIEIPLEQLLLEYEYSEEKLIKIINLVAF